MRDDGSAVSTPKRFPAILTAATASRGRSTKRVVQSWLGVASLALSQGCGGAPKTSIAVAPADSIVLERTMCYGTCPAYRLSVTAGGRASFLSLNPGDSGRAASDVISRENFGLLVSQAQSLGFFALPDTIRNDRTLCPDFATDHPTAIVTLFRNAGSKQVVDYHGCFARSDHSTVPIVTQLRAFEAKIDSTAGSARWVRAAPLKL